MQWITGLCGNKNNKERSAQCPASYKESWDVLRIERAETEADARAKMLIYLIENKLFTV